MEQVHRFDHVPANFGFDTTPGGPSLNDISLHLAVPLHGCTSGGGRSRPPRLGSGSVLLVSRGFCNFTEKILWAQSIRAAGVVVYDDQPRGDERWGVIMTAEDAAQATSVTIPSVFVSYETGLALTQALTGGKLDGGSSIMWQVVKGASRENIEAGELPENPECSTKGTSSSHTTHVGAFFSDAWAQVGDFVGKVIHNYVCKFGGYRRNRQVGRRRKSNRCTGTRSFDGSEDWRHEDTRVVVTMNEIGNVLLDSKSVR